MDKSPQVSIIILNRNGRKDTIECLSSLQKISYTNYNVFLVDNCSNDESVKKINTYIENNKISFNITFVQNDKNTGFAEGNNIIMKKLLNESDTDYILLLNNDTTVNKNFLDILVNFAERNHDCGSVAAKNYYYDKKDIIWYAGANFNKRTGTTQHKFIGEKDCNVTQLNSITSYGVGSCVLFPIQVLKKVGIFRPEYFAYCEDVDLAIRIRKAGYNNYYCGEAFIYHKVNVTSNKMKEKQSFRLGRNKVWLIKKNFNIFVYIIFLIFYPLKIISTLLRGKVDKISYIRGCIMGIISQ